MSVLKRREGWVGEEGKRRNGGLVGWVNGWLS